MFSGLHHILALGCMAIAQSGNTTMVSPRWRQLKSSCLSTRVCSFDRFLNALASCEIDSGVYDSGLSDGVWWEASPSPGA